MGCLELDCGWWLSEAERTRRIGSQRLWLQLLMEPPTHEGRGPRVVRGIPTVWIELGRFSLRTQCGREWVRHDGGEWDAPTLDDLGQPAGGWDSVLEVVSPLLGRHLLNVSRDAIQREDVTPHSEFSSWIFHFNLEFQYIDQRNKGFI